MTVPLPMFLALPTDIFASLLLLAVTLRAMGLWWHRWHYHRHRASQRASWRWLRSVPWGATCGVAVVLLADVLALTLMLSNPAQGVMLSFLAVALLAVYTGIARGIKNLEQQEQAVSNQ